MEADDMARKTRIDLQNFIIRIMNENAVSMHGFGYLGDILHGKFRKLKYAISIALNLKTSIVDSIISGPNEAYCDEYKDVNLRLDSIATNLENGIKKKGYSVLSIPASETTDLIHIKGEFPHKTAATRAGLGWIGRSSLLITRECGPRVRLSTILTDMPLECAIPIEEDSCGKCTECIDACPAKAIVGQKWYPGLSRAKLVDVYKCDNWKKKNYFELCEGHVCGICVAVCPFGRKEKLIEI
jgi:epoxyqueuosine reductase QueG